MALLTLLAAAAVLSSGAALLHYAFVRHRRLPPGPRPFPFIGNLLDIYQGDIHVKARDWSRQLDTDMISLNILGNTMIIINSAKTAADIFDKRGAIYSDRPDMPMIVDLMGWDWTFALMRYGPRWKEHRRVFHSHFNHSVSEHQHLQRDIARELLQLLWHRPEHYVEHLRHYAAQIIMKRVYGHTVKDNQDPFVRLVKDASASASEAAVPGAFLVDLFPSLKYVPEWMPGAGFKRKAREWRTLASDMINAPYDMVKAKFLLGKAESCFVSECLERNATCRMTGENDTLSEDLIKDTAAVAYAAGADTTVSTLTTFILAMCLYPDIQRRAQSELDVLLRSSGQLDRLPSFSDKKDLPYLTALVKEVLRWMPVLPLAVPHRSIQDDYYRDYFIPKNATVIGNAWAILHDETMFPSPEVFDPERFLHNAELPDPSDLGVFGFGRRTCAGKVMALDTIWIAVASILAVFDIAREKDAFGGDVIPEIVINPGAISHLAPFPCTIAPRSSTTLAMILGS